MLRPRLVELATSLVGILFIVRIPPTQADPNPDVSNGTCYYSAGEQADSAYIPCGNTAFGTFACCEAGSYCLGDHSCFSDIGTTYVAGCTDHTYSDPACPAKGPYSSSQWSGLVYCNGTSNEWTLCDNSADGDLPVFGPPCWCPESSRVVAFEAVSTLPASLSLPASAGEVMSFIGGYTPGTVLTTPSTTPSKTPTPTPTPTTSPTPPSTSKVTSTSKTTSASKTTSNLKTTPTSIPASKSRSTGTSAKTPPSSSRSSTVTTGLTLSDSPSSSFSAGSSSSSSVSGPVELSGPEKSTSGLSTGAKAAIGLGAGIGGCIVLAVLIGCLYIRRRNRRRSTFGGPRSAIMARPQMAETMSDRGHYGGVAAERGPAWSGRRSELQGDDRAGPEPESRQPSWMEQSSSRPISTEVEGSTPTYYQSMGSLASRSQELVGESSSMSAFSQPYKKAQVSQIGARAPKMSASYMPGTHAGGDFYEMPAHIPGSTLR